MLTALGPRVLQAKGAAKDAGKAAADAAAARAEAAKKASALSMGKLILQAAERDPLRRDASTASPPKTYGHGKVGRGDARAPNPESEAPGASDAAGKK